MPTFISMSHIQYLEWLVLSCYVFAAVMLIPDDNVFYFGQIKNNIHYVTL